MKCDDGFYVDDKGKCKKLPNNCLEADTDGNCTKCKDGYFINKNKKCRKIPENCQTVNDTGDC